MDTEEPTLGVQPPPLTESAVHLWLLSSEVPSARYDVLAAALDDSERQRASAYHFERDRRRFVAVRGSLRQLLGAYARRPATEFRFLEGPGGKPRLDPGVCPKLSFNLSRSQGWALIGVAAGASIGVDIETVRNIPEHEDIARRHFATAEIESLRRLPAADVAERFLVGWTLKEAYVKATGDGLSARLPGFDVLSDPGFVRVLQPGSSERAAGWRLFRLHPAAATVAALAVRIAQPDLTCFGFRPYDAEKGRRT
jgi:4'-phosphopantetheinyl transferase